MWRTDVPHPATVDRRLPTTVSAVRLKSALPRRSAPAWGSREVTKVGRGYPEIPRPVSIFSTTPRVPDSPGRPGTAGVAYLPGRNQRTPMIPYFPNCGIKAGVRRKTEGEGTGSNPLVFYFKIIYFMSQSLFVKTTNIQFGSA